MAVRAQAIGRRCGDHASHRIEAQAELILTTYEARPAIFPHELRDALAERGVQTSTNSLSRFFARHGITRKRMARPVRK